MTTPGTSLQSHAINGWPSVNEGVAPIVREARDASPVIGIAGEALDTAPDVLTIRVTQEDIDKGLPSDCLRCPIALAVERAGGLAPNVTAKFVWAAFGADEIPAQYRMSEGAYRFIYRFDSLWSQKPATFRLKRVGA